MQQEMTEIPLGTHDVGQYPLANGQVYGYDRKTRGDAGLLSDACGRVRKYDPLCGSPVQGRKFSGICEKHKEALKRLDRLSGKRGLGSENQLCTDDFAGHLAHNRNLAVKGILGIAAWAELLRGLGETEKRILYRKQPFLWQKPGKKTL